MLTGVLKTNLPDVIIHVDQASIIRTRRNRRNRSTLSQAQLPPCTTVIWSWDDKMDRQKRVQTFDNNVLENKWQENANIDDQ